MISSRSLDGRKFTLMVPSPLNFSRLSPVLSSSMAACRPGLARTRRWAMKSLPEFSSSIALRRCSRYWASTSSYGSLYTGSWLVKVSRSLRLAEMALVSGTCRLPVPAVARSASSTIASVGPDTYTWPSANSLPRTPSLPVTFSTSSLRSRIPTPITILLRLRSPMLPKTVPVPLTPSVTVMSSKCRPLLSIWKGPLMP